MPPHQLGSQSELSLAPVWSFFRLSESTSPPPLPPLFSHSLISPCHLSFVPPICCLLLLVFLCFLSCLFPLSLLLPVFCCNCETCAVPPPLLSSTVSPHLFPPPSASPLYNRPCGGIWLSESCDGEWASAARTALRPRESVFLWCVCVCVCAWIRVRACIFFLFVYVGTTLHK